MYSYLKYINKSLHGTSTRLAMPILSDSTYSESSFLESPVLTSAKSMLTLLFVGDVGVIGVIFGVLILIFDFTLKIDVDFCIRVRKFAATDLAISGSFSFVIVSSI